MDLVIARYSEKVDWLLEVPENINIILYNKGEDDIPGRVQKRLDRLVKLRNFGRESETYLHHMLHADLPSGGSTIFCQGDPFSHSPDFLKLLHVRDEWDELQPLTVQWLEEHQIPPRLTLENEQEEYLGRLRVRSEIFSVYTWSPVKFHDEAAMQIGRSYLSGQSLPLGTNIAEHFLRSAGWDDLADEAAQADFGQSCHGAIFAVSNRLLARMPRAVAEAYHLKTRAHPVFGYIFERMWLHFFGMPFHRKIVRHRVGDLVS